MTDYNDPPWLYLIDPPSQIWREKEIGKRRDPHAFIEEKLTDDGLWPAKDGLDGLKTELAKNAKLLREIHAGNVSQKKFGPFALRPDVMRPYVEGNIARIEKQIREAK